MKIKNPFYNPFKRVDVDFIYEEVMEIVNQFGLVAKESGSSYQEFGFPDYSKRIIEIQFLKVGNSKKQLPKTIKIGKKLYLGIKRSYSYDYELERDGWLVFEKPSTEFLWDWKFYKKCFVKELEKIQYQIVKDDKLSKKISLFRERFSNV
jgi:hypothetical protein